MLDVRQEVQEILKNPNELLTSDSCSGYPYLSLSVEDYSLRGTSEVFADYVALIKKYSQSSNWQNSKCSFFDVHPVFSDATPIPSLMGLHLSLFLYDKGIADTAQTLYFDTVSNWRKFSRITEKRRYPVASWIKFNLSDIQDEVAEDEDAADQDIFLRTSVYLVKGNELSSIHKEAPTDFNSNLVAYYRGQGLRNILLDELQKYRAFIEYDLRNAPALERSAQYLFAVIFCREFGLPHSVFLSVVNELDLKFDFGLDIDVVNHTYRCLHYIHDLKIQIGDYEHQFIDFNQTHAGLSGSQAETAAQTEAVQDETPGGSDVVGFTEERKNYSIEGVSRYYEMQPAIRDEFECRQIIARVWRGLVILFYGKQLTQNLYDRLRSLMDAHITTEIQDKALLSFANYDTQLKAIHIAAYEAYVKTVFDFNILNRQGSMIAENLFEFLNRPKLTENQQTSINLLNEKAQKEMIASIMEDHLINLNQLLTQSIGKIAHSNFIRERGARLSQIDSDTYRQMVIMWYRENYIKAYLELSHDYEEVYALIKRDATQFAQNPLIEKSMLIEVRYFVASSYNPYLILDFNTNY